MKLKFVFSLLITLAAAIFFLPLPSQSKTVEVTARVGGYLIEYLTGWTSPYSEVLLSALNFSQKTVADNNGFFAFYNLPVPENTGELCLISQDVSQYASSLICLPAPPADKNMQIQDVLLSPSLSLETDSIPSGKTTKASGMTFPNSEVDVYLFVESKFSFWARLVKTVWAAGLPKYQVKSNENGYFEFSLPAVFPSDNRLFAVSYLSDLSNLGNLSNSPKSNTLAFEVIGFWGQLRKFLKDFFSGRLL